MKVYNINLGKNKELFEKCRALNAYSSFVAFAKQAKEEGVEKGRNEKALEDAKNLLKLNILSLEQISSVVNLPIEQLQEIQKTL